MREVMRGVLGDPNAELRIKRIDEGEKTFPAV